MASGPWQKSGRLNACPTRLSWRWTQAYGPEVCTVGPEAK
jgi:hypothetical protein